MDTKMFAAPAHLVAVFEHNNAAHEQNTVTCPVVALTETEFGQLRAMCAVPDHEYFVPIEDVQPYLHKSLGGIYTFLRYAYAEQATGPAVLEALAS